MAKQRLIICSINEFGLGRKGEPIVVDLSPAALGRSHPAVARAIGGSRIVSHAITAHGYDGPTITFVVED
jgi:hypothetical protein